MRKGIENGKSVIYYILKTLKPQHDAVPDGDNRRYAQGRQNQAFRQEQTDEPEAPGANSPEYGKFARSRAGRIEEVPQRWCMPPQGPPAQRIEKITPEFPIKIVSSPPPQVPKLETGVHCRAAVCD